MKGYNLITQEISLGSRSVNVVPLGEEGRYRKRLLIPVEGGGGDLSSCELEVKVPKPGHPGKPVIRVVHGESTPGWIARVSTNAGYRRGASGRVDAPAGVELIQYGTFRFGHAGGVGGGYEYLLKVPVDGWIIVRPTRGVRYVLYFGAEVQRLSLEEAEPFLPLHEAAEIEIDY